jgi:hypothetical protein
LSYNKTLAPYGFCISCCFWADHPGPAKKTKQHTEPRPQQHPTSGPDPGEQTPGERKLANGTGLKEPGEKNRAPLTPHPKLITPYSTSATNPALPLHHHTQHHMLHSYATSHRGGHRILFRIFVCQISPIYSYPGVHTLCDIYRGGIHMLYPYATSAIYIGAAHPVGHVSSYTHHPSQCFHNFKAMFIASFLSASHSVRNSNRTAGSMSS